MRFVRRAMMPEGKVNSSHENHSSRGPDIPTLGLCCLALLYSIRQLLERAALLGVVHVRTISRVISIWVVLCDDGSVPLRRGS